MSLFIAVRQMGSLLENLETWLDEAVENAKLFEQYMAKAKGQ